MISSAKLVKLERGKNDVVRTTLIFAPNFIVKISFYLRLLKKENKIL